MKPPPLGSGLAFNKPLIGSLMVNGFLKCIIHKTTKLEMIWRSSQVSNRLNEVTTYMWC